MAGASPWRTLREGGEAVRSVAVSLKPYMLVFMALAFGGLWNARIPGLAFVGVFVGVGAFSYFNGSLESTCLRESNYFCLKVAEREIEGRTIRTLTLDQLLHSYVSIEDPTYLVYRYENVFADVATYIARDNHDLRALFIGGGGYTMPRFLEVTYPESTLEVIEIDPAVTQVANEYLGLIPNTKIVTYNQDARMSVPRLENGQYDLIIGDAFNDVSVPYHLTTLEFNEQLHDLLTDEGDYMVNVVDKRHSGQFLRAYVNTLSRTFPYVYVMRDDENWEDDGRYTYVVAGSRRPLTSDALIAANTNARRGYPVTRIMPEDTLVAWLNNGKRNVLLTDDYVPVDNMLAPLYLESR